MTNKQKYPNAEIEKNPSCSIDICGGIWYVKLGNGFYLKNDNTVGKHEAERPNFTYYKTKIAAQQALNKFMKDKPEITLSEIKSQYEEAKKLIGKKVAGPYISYKFTVKEVHLEIIYEPSSTLCNEFFEKNGYVIKVCGGCHIIPYTPDIKIIESVSVVAHDSKTYIAVDDGECWQFGCAKISKSLIEESYELLDTIFSDGNRQITKITIGACDFDRATLKSLVDLQNK